jgi:hypothetical protein
MIARLQDDDVTITLSQVHVCVHVCLLFLFADRTPRQIYLHASLHRHNLELKTRDAAKSEYYILILLSLGSSVSEVTTLRAGRPGFDYW